jgi:cell division protein FtsB
MKVREDPVRLLGRRILLVALVGVAIVAALGVWNTYEKDREAAVLDSEAQAQAKDLVQRETELKADIANLQTNRGKEAALRQQYALAGQGEGVVIIVNQSAQSAPTASTSAFVEWLHKAFPWW